MDSTASRSPCFAEADNGLASIVDAEEAGFSGHHHHNPFVSIRAPYYTSLQTRGSLRNLSLISSYASASSRSARFHDGRFEEINHPHFLDACFLCKKLLGGNKDIFMYRGDTPFCSQECRREQIEKDEAKENELNIFASMKALRKDQKKNSNSTTSPNKTKPCPFPTSTLAAA